jgi:hypothetical protein
MKLKNLKVVSKVLQHAESNGIKIGRNGRSRRSQIQIAQRLSSHLTYLFLKDGPTLLFAIFIIAFDLINIKF